MKVYIVENQHGAGATEILAVLKDKPSKEQIEKLAATRSSYDAEERAEWCELFRNEYEVEGACPHEQLNDHGDACLDCGAVYIDGEGWQ